MSDVGRGRRGRISWVIPQILMCVQMPPSLLRATPVSPVQGETVSLFRINSCRKRAHKLLVQTKPEVCHFSYAGKHGTLSCLLGLAQHTTCHTISAPLA